MLTAVFKNAKISNLLSANDIVFMQKCTRFFAIYPYFDENKP